MDARWLIAAGLLVIAAGNYWMALMNLEISPFWVIWPRVVMVVGLSMVFAPISVAAFKYTPRAPARGGDRPVLAAPQRGGKRRYVGGPDRDRKSRTVPPGACRRVPRPVQSGGDLLSSSKPLGSFSSRHGDPALSQADGLASTRGSARVAGVIPGLLRRLLAVRRHSRWACILVPLMKRSVAEKGAHIGAE